MEFFRKLFFWRRTNIILENVIDDDEEDKYKYIDQLKERNELIEKFGTHETHVKNLNNSAIILDKTIGSGAFSLVKKGFSTTNKTHLAVKIILLEDEQNKSYVSNFLPRELKLWTELSIDKHPNVLELD